MDREWEGGRPAGVRWGRVVMALVLAAVVAATAWAQLGGGRLTVQRDAAPIAGVTEPPKTVVEGPLEAGDRWYCSRAAPIPAYADGRYYPVHYPPDDRFVREPEACYADATRAESDGFRLAPAPPGSRVGGGLYLVEARYPTPGQCRDLADRAGYAIPCPRLLPAPGFGPSCLEQRCRYGDGVIIEIRGFPLPPHWCELCGAHLVITATPRHGPAELLPCHDRTRLEPTGRAPAAAQPVGCSSSDRPWLTGLGGFPHESHTVMTWQRDGVVYAASIEGVGAAQARALEVLVDGLVLVGGRPTRE